MSAIVASSSSRRMSAALRPLSFHPHVEGGVEAQRKAALRLVELHRRDADVEHDSVGLLEAEGLRDRAEVAEARFDQAQPAARSRDEIGAAANGGGIAVERDNVRAAVEQRPRIAAGAERCVDDQRPFARLKRLENLGEENRDMTRSLAHAAANWRCARPSSATAGCAPPRDSRRSGTAPRSGTCAPARRTPLPRAGRATPSAARRATPGRPRPCAGSRSSP